MSSVSPSSSASNADVSSVSGLNVAECLMRVQELAEKGFLTPVGVENFVRQLLPAYQSYVRKSPSQASSDVSGTASVSSAGCGSAGQKLGVGGEKLNKGSQSERNRPCRRSWGSGPLPPVGPVGVQRKRSWIERVPLPTRADVSSDWRSGPQSVAEKQGSCYQRMLRPGVDTGLSYPDFFQLLALPADSFESRERLDSLKVTTPVGGVAHVGSDGVFTAAQLLGHMAATASMPYAGSASMWSCMRDSDKLSGVQLAGFTHNTVLGADIVGEVEDKFAAVSGKPVGKTVFVDEVVWDSSDFEAKVVQGRRCGLVVVVRSSGTVVGFVPVSREVKTASQVATALAGRRDPVSGKFRLFTTVGTGVFDTPRPVVAWKFSGGDIAEVKSESSAFVSLQELIDSFYRRGASGDSVSAACCVVV